MTKKEKNEMLLEGCKEGNYDKVRLALNFGADVRAKDVYGNTPLHSVIGKNGSKQHFRRLSNGRMKIIKLLLKAGAGVGAKDKWERTPYNMAHTDKMKDLLKKYIKKHLQI